MISFKATLYSTVLLGAATLTAPVMATTFVAADSSPGTQVCMAVASNKQLTLLKTIKELHTNKHVIGKKLRCNDLSMNDFVALYDLDKSARFFNIEATTSTSIRDLAKVNKLMVVIMAGSK
ncbi:hypothetical protein CWB58_19065 [Pseudoalteromonas sp. S201]|uniref:DUF3718 domain-containing protein n=1 Tax=Pseudoalteromonas sp. S201 TaxID=579519 RepID=UPI00110CB55A|nr:DUF3718 domain-containing protein [Pseudoalteromonas sp. S201]TMS91530.1 hypothetical protein CWB58_19065 [Pseudoalteromonas sp. S201]